VWDPCATELASLESALYQAGRIVVVPSPAAPEGKEGSEGVNLHPHLRKVVLRGELKWEPLEADLARAKLRFAGKLRAMPGTRLVKKVVEAPLHSVGKRGQRTWGEKVHSLIDKLGLKEQFSAIRGPCGLPAWKRAVEKALRDKSMSDWNSEILHNPEELHLYSQLKRVPSQERYLFAVAEDDGALVSAARVQLNMRGGWTSTSDWKHPDKCRVCGRETPETPEHLLMECVGTDELRRVALEEIRGALHPRGSSPGPGFVGNAERDFMSMSSSMKAAVLLGRRRKYWSQAVAQEVDVASKRFCLAVWRRVAAVAAGKKVGVVILDDDLSEGEDVARDERQAPLVGGLRASACARSVVVVPHESGGDAEGPKPCLDSAVESLAGRALACPGVDAHRMASG
jgi:hypothetical protein